MEWYWYLLIYIWYLAGSLGGIRVAKLMVDKLSRLDYFIFFTIGGVLGLINVLIGLYYLVKYNKTKRQIKEYQKQLDKNIKKSSSS